MRFFAEKIGLVGGKCVYKKLPCLRVSASKRDELACRRDAFKHGEFFKRFKAVFYHGLLGSIEINTRDFVEIFLDIFQ